MTLINVFTVEPEDQRRLVELLIEPPRFQCVGRRALFLPACIAALMGRRSRCTQWRSIDNYQAMREDPVPLPFLQEALTIAKFEPGVYEDVQTFTPGSEPN